MPAGRSAGGRRILVTGGAGFIGSNLVRALLARGDRVRVLDDLSNGDLEHLAGTDVEITTADVRDGDAVERAAAGMDAVVHLAAAGSVVASIEDPASNLDVNVVGTFRVLEAARRTGIERMVLASTGGALFGLTDPPVDEQSLPSPISPYGSSKLAGEGYARAYAHSYGLHTVVLRFGNVYGPLSNRKSGAVNSFFRALIGGQPLVIYGDGSASRDYIHVDDICNAMVLALDKDVPAGTALHVASGQETTLVELARLCRATAGAPCHPVVHHPARVGEVHRNFASYRLAATLLGYSPRVRLSDGLARTWEWIREQPLP